MKTLTIALLLSLLLGLTACAGPSAAPPNSVPLGGSASETQPPPPTSAVEVTKMPSWTPAVDPVNTQAPALTPTILPKPVFKTSLGELVIESVRWVDEVNGVRPGPDERIMLLILGKPGQAPLDPGNFSLETFDKALRDQSNGEVHISGDDGSYGICSMAGWVEPKYEEFAMGFRLPLTAKTFQLFWPGNEPIDLYPVD